MQKICFVCYGNICRSPMAEYIMKKLLEEKNLLSDYEVYSRATSFEEIGNDIYPLAKEKLREKNIPFSHHEARRLKKDDKDKYDYIIGMEEENLEDIYSILDSKDKVYRLLDFTDDKRDIVDPWFTRDFDTCYKDILNGCKSFLSYLEKR